MTLQLLYKQRKLDRQNQKEKELVIQLNKEFDEINASSGNNDLIKMNREIILLDWSFDETDEISGDDTDDDDDDVEKDEDTDNDCDEAVNDKDQQTRKTFAMLIHFYVPVIHLLFTSFRFGLLPLCSA